MITFCVRGVKYQHDNNTLPLPDAIAITKYCGQSLAEWSRGVGSLDPVSLAAVYWLATRKTSGVSFADVLADESFDLAEMIRTWYDDSSDEAPEAGAGNVVSAAEEAASAAPTEISS